MPVASLAAETQPVSHREMGDTSPFPCAVKKGNSRESDFQGKDSLPQGPIFIVCK